MLIDFGVAKARDRVSQETSAGQLKGKIRYMAPEQALGRNIDHRADVWALGAILYELFAGVPPYDGPNEVATLHKLTSGTMPAPLPAFVAPPIRAVIDRALAYDAEERYATALELNLALEACMVEIGEPTNVAVVAHYTAQLLSERKAARKRAVDTALGAAHARDAAGRASSMPMSVPQALASSPSAVSSPSGPSAASGPNASGYPQGPSSNNTGRHQAIPLPIAPPSHGELVSSPSNMGVSGLSEVPSATSSATLGSAAMEYPPELVEDPARRRRFVAAAVLGVSVAAGVVGAVLIISTAILKHNDGGTSGASGTTHTTAPPEATDPGSLGNTGAGGTGPSGTATNAGEAPPAATVTAPAPSAAATGAPAVTAQAAATGAAAATATTTAAAPTATSTSFASGSSGTSTTSSPHRPSTPPPVPPPKPAVKPATTATTPKPPDRGF